MTKFILHGGGIKVSSEPQKIEFYQEWIQGFSSEYTPTILLVYFSRDEKKWETSQEKDKQRFLQYTDYNTATFLLADKNIENFKEQIKKSDIVFFAGGDTDKIMAQIKSIRKKDFLNLLDNKVFVGSSAGVMFMSNFTRSYNIDWMKGLGVLPMNTIVHYSPDLQKNLNDFKRKHPNDKNEYILLPETEFVVRKY